MWRVSGSQSFASDVPSGLSPWVIVTLCSFPAEMPAVGGISPDSPSVSDVVPTGPTSSRDTIINSRPARALPKVSRVRRRCLSVAELKMRQG